MNENLHDTFIKRLDSLSIQIGTSKRKQGFPFSELMLSEKRRYLEENVGISQETVKKWYRADNKDVPKADTLLSLSAHFHVSVDYLLGNADFPEDYGEKYVHDTLGLTYDAIRMIKKFLTNTKFAEKNRNCLDTLNLLLADYNKQIEDAGGNNGFTHKNIFNDVWEYLHSEEAYYQPLNEDIGDSKQKHFWVGFDSESVEVQTINDAIEYRARKNILKKLDELKEKISRH